MYVKNDVIDDQAFFHNNERILYLVCNTKNDNARVEVFHFRF